MTLTSLIFYLFFGISLILYYITPRKKQWYMLLLFSVAFFLMSSTPFTAIYTVFAIVSTHFCSHYIYKAREAGKEGFARASLVIGLIVNLGILAVLKYNGFVLGSYSVISHAFGLPSLPKSLSLIAPLGISFYTFQAVGLLVDSYWSISMPPDKLLKTALFVGYWPQLTSGPIARYDEIGAQLFAGHEFSWKNLTFGLQRMLWGIFKKLVISSRLAVIVNTIYGDVSTYNGFYIWLAACLFMLQLYTDFSGCMDIIIGASECYGVILPENFRTPFFSRSVQEFWQRWHITLGGWMKNFVLYPILRTKAWAKMGKSLKPKLGKKAARQIPSFLGMLCVWLLIGLWHGGKYKYIVGQGIWFWCWIVFEQVFEPHAKRINSFLKIDSNSFGWHVFQSVRTYLIVCFGNMFFRLNSLKETISTIKLGFRTTSNPWIFFDGSLYNLGLNSKNFWIMIIGIFVLLTVSALQEKESVRERLERQHIVFRWIVLYSLILGILIFGMYGPGYQAAEFIYKGF